MNQTGNKQIDELKEMRPEQVIIVVLCNTKKFLYTGPKKEENDDQWIFTPRKDNVTRSDNSELEDVWSIKKNVSVNGTKQRPVGNEGLSLKANTTYYSRYGGVNKAGSNMTSWNSNYTSKGFSYSSFGGKEETPRSSRSVSGPSQQLSTFNKDPSLW
ncbi:hypothetical protein FSP39_020545 [Pinctada imbricata]|uniref:Uncharacterized protein n=1 Tax=Pinctada imbricata TaxID=66713 RepID=A0AA89BY01_PINIB|nr:hypothetical protein FSP39_020545 [Pinctada imbricata]